MHAILVLLLVLRVVDGDTVVVAGDVHVRLLGVDTPELNGQCPAEDLLAELARDHVVAWIDAAGGAVALVPERGPGTAWTYDRWGRLLATVNVDGIDLAERLIGAGLGRPYDGGRRESWCE